MDIAIPRDGDGPEFDQATRRLRDKDRVTTGKDGDNPILETLMYGVEYLDFHNEPFTANTIT